MIQARSIDDELEKNSDIKREDIQKLREWVNSQPHLPGELITDLDLILAFNACDKSAEVSKQVLDLNFTLRTQLPLLKDLKFDDSIRISLSAILNTMLPITTKKGEKAILVSVIDTDPKKCGVVPYLRALTMLVDLWQYRDGTWPGYVFIINTENSTASNIFRMEITALQQYIYFAQEALFSKITAIHVLNTVSLFDKVLTMTKPFLKNELLNKLFLHPSNKIPGNEELNAALPKELGGEGKSIIEMRDETLQLIEENADFFVLQSNKKVDESKRPGKQKTVSDFFGSIEGSFKKLDID